MNPDNHVIEVIHQLIEWAALGIEVLAVATPSYLCARVENK